MVQTPQSGTRFHWIRADSTEAGTAVVDLVRSDRSEGFSPEVEDYAAAWLEASGVEGSRAGDRFTMLLARDEKNYLDGKQIYIQFL